MGHNGASQADVEGAAARIRARTVTTAGSPSARARGQGQLARLELPRALRAMTELSALPAWLLPRLKEPALKLAVPAVGWRFLHTHRALWASWRQGKLWTMLEGLHQGSGASLALLSGFAAFEVLASTMSFTFGCSAIAFAAEATVSGRPWLAYNHDFPPAFAPFLLVRRTLPDDGYRSVAITYPMLLGALAGVNEAGLAVSLNHAWVKHVPWRPAVPISWLVQDVLDHCGSVAEAVTLLRAAPVPNGSIVTLVDKSGERAIVELAPSCKRVRRADGPLLHTFNKYRHPDMEALEVPVGARGKGGLRGLDIHSANLGRQARYDSLGVSLRRGFDLEAVRAVMGDHAYGVGHSDTICRHNDALSETLLSLVLDPADACLHLVLGHACSSTYTRVDLADAPSAYTSGALRTRRSSAQPVASA